MSSVAVGTATGRERGAVSITLGSVSCRAEWRPIERHISMNQNWAFKIKSLNALMISCLGVVLTENSSDVMYFRKSKQKNITCTLGIERHTQTESHENSST